MRVSDRILFQTLGTDLQENMERAVQLHEKLSSGKRINRSSDDPIAFSSALNIRTALSNTDQFLRNMDQGLSFLNLSDSTLAEVGNLLIRAKELSISQANATMSPQDRSNASREAQALFNQVVQLANTRLGERYIFAGFETSTAPFDSVGTYSGDNGDIQVEVGPNVTIVINSPGDEVFTGAGGGINIFTVLSGLQTALATSSVSGINTAITNLDTAINQVLNHRADLGARANRMRSTAAAHEDFRVNLTAVLSKAEDADVAKVAADLALQQNALEAIRTSARMLISQSLMDFLQ